MCALSDALTAHLGRTEICPDLTAPRSTFTATRTSAAPLPRSSADGKRSRSSTVHNSSFETALPSTQAVKHCNTFLFWVSRIIPILVNTFRHLIFETNVYQV
ncbi:hypothetical protein TorRG33x02_013270 [Trema orientale]|uniref:Uncharacterized protein n=1 Tax=Trema orientale TaxID=63057 RepID=A0A2P5FZQ5_TREOI|nr:hypothetical protein TorRG33x02_013270 [Trema orientale]